MKYCIVVFSCVLGLNFTFAQTKAVTENGDEVVLHADGTWEFMYKQIENVEIPTNPKIFKKGASSTFLLKSTKASFGFWIDPKKWSFEKSGDDKDTEYALQLKKEDLYSLILTEKIEMPIQSLKEVAIENARSVAPDVKVVKEEYRNVNGLTVLFLQMNGTLKGIKFTYYGYYYSGTGGTIQFLTYTAQSLMDKYIADCELLLNGLVELK